MAELSKASKLSEAPAARDPDSVFTEEHHIFRETCRRFYEKELEPNYLRWEKDVYKRQHRIGIARGRRFRQLGRFG